MINLSTRNQTILEELEKLKNNKKELIKEIKKQTEFVKKLNLKV